MSKSFAEHIKSHDFLNDFFSEFPSKLMEVALQGYVIKFRGNDIMIDLHALNSYLQSDASIFTMIDSVQEFFEILTIVGFHKSKIKRFEGRTFVQMRNSNFKSDQLPTQGFYEQIQEQDSSKKRGQKTSKRLILINSSSVIQKLTVMANRELTMSRLEFERIKLSFLLESRKAMKRHQTHPDLIEYQMEEHDYIKEGQIAGFYGNVTSEQLKKAFGKYLPVYSTDIVDEIKSEPEIVAETVEIANEIESENGKKKRKYNKKRKTETVAETDEEFIAITETPKKRKYNKKPRQIMPQETQHATEFLQQENKEIDQAEILEFLTDLNYQNV